MEIQPEAPRHRLSELQKASKDWSDWKWQLRHSLKSLSAFSEYFDLTAEEVKGFEGAGSIFSVRTTPYYASLADPKDSKDPIRQIFMPLASELRAGAQQMLDPLNEKNNNPAPRVIHRYRDRALFLVTDTCSVYCRYCTRKHFTGKAQAFVRSLEYEQALDYYKKSTDLREIILSGGDPLTLSDSQLSTLISDLASIKHIEIIRVGTRMPVVCPMRVTPQLVQILRQAPSVFLMSHFNHRNEITTESRAALAALVDGGVPVLNQMVLLKGINDSPEAVAELSRALLRARVKPYYMFICDPSEGSDHMRTSIPAALKIQKKLWGHLSGIAMPTLALDIPGGGGKVAFTPDFVEKREGAEWHFKGYDGGAGVYIDPK